MRPLGSAWRPSVLGVVVLVAATFAVGGVRKAGASAAELAGGRGYELVSPPQKTGGDVAADTGRERAASDGSAATFSSVNGFGDVRGAGIGTDYMSVRSTNPSPGNNGWTTHAITPQLAPQTILAGFQGFDSLWLGELSANFSSGVFRAWSPLSAAPNVADVGNIYVRHDLRSEGAGSYQLASDCPACTLPLPPVFFFGQLPALAGTSMDFTHVLFESVYPLTADATADGFFTPNLYESVNGAVRLVGILPDSACGSPPCPAIRSIAGQGAGSGFMPAIYTPRTISADGSRVFFTVGDDSASAGALYLRDDHGTSTTADDSTVQINASERTDCADQDPCSGVPEPDPGGAQTATYWNASTDGSRAFFTSTEQLTNDDNNSTVDLYMYDVGASPGHHLTRLSVDNQPADGTADVDGVVGVSDNGRFVYFMAHSQLVAGKAPFGGGGAMFVWHDESGTPTIAYVGHLADDFANLPLTWGAGQAAAWRARVTPDGKHLLFSSQGGPGLLSAHGGVDYDQGHCGGFPCREFYLYNVVSDSLVCASCNPTGAPATAPADIWARTGNGSAQTTFHLNHALSDDGRFVFFRSRDALVPGDANHKEDVYEFDAGAGPQGPVHLVSGGTDPSDSFFIDASSSGHDVFFLTRQQLVGWDRDQNYDLYDARVGGGFPEPSPVKPGCVGEACRAAISTPAPDASAGSALFHGVGNEKRVAKPKVKPKRVFRCKRGFLKKRVRRKVRCVKRLRRTVRHVAKTPAGSGSK